MTPRRILVVEDHRESREALTDLLGLWGHDVQATDEGGAGLAIARSWRPDVVLLDLGLRDIDGYEVARRLSKLPESQRPVIIAVTGYGDPDAVWRALDAGCDAHLLKPYDPTRLAAMIESGGDLRVRAARATK